MAVQVDQSKTVEWDKVTTRTRRPWDQWANGERWMILPGEDFDIEPTAMTAQLRQYAAKNEIQVRHRIEGDNSIVFEFYENGS